MVRLLIVCHGGQQNLVLTVASGFGRGINWIENEILGLSFYEFNVCLCNCYGILRSEKNTKIGSALSGALVSTLVGLAASNLGLISTTAPAYSHVLEFLLPLAVPLLLYRADLRRVIKSTGALLLAFLLGSGNTHWY